MRAITPNSSARARLPRQFAVAARDRGVEQAAQVQRLALGRAARAFEQADHEVLHRLRARRFDHRLARLPRDHAERGAEHHRHQRRGRQRPAVARHVLVDPVAHALRARQHRPT
ncbi:hypothetical protein FE772_01605 [Lysobacter enzymogenes]|nr:hypothetical protein [Lysobacter enzymogenes]QCW24563.1 hypothetical protein FE772_01605 [Lysobacter enzymogenes]